MTGFYVWREVKGEKGRNPVLGTFGWEVVKDGQRVALTNSKQSAQSAAKRLNEGGLL